MGYPYFNPPTTQKVNKIEEGNFFVPTLGVLPESVTEEYTPAIEKALKRIKVSMWILAAIGWLLLGATIISDTLSKGMF